MRALVKNYVLTKALVYKTISIIYITHTYQHSEMKKKHILSSFQSFQNSLWYEVMRPNLDQVQLKSTHNLSKTATVSIALYLYEKTKILFN